MITLWLIFFCRRCRCHATHTRYTNTMYIFVCTVDFGLVGGRWNTLWSPSKFLFLSVAGEWLKFNWVTLSEAINFHCIFFKILNILRHKAQTTKTANIDDVRRATKWLMTENWRWQHKIAYNYFHCYSHKIVWQCKAKVEDIGNLFHFPVPCTTYNN